MPQQKASSSLVVLLLIVIVGAGIYFMWYFKNRPRTLTQAEYQEICADGLYAVRFRQQLSAIQGGSSAVIEQFDQDAFANGHGFRDGIDLETACLDGKEKYGAGDVSTN